MDSYPRKSALVALMRFLHSCRKSLGLRFWHAGFFKGLKRDGCHVEKLFCLDSLYNA